MIEKEYAKALIETHPNIDLCLEEFECAVKFFDDLKPIMDSPKISKEEKKNIIKKSFKGFTDEFIYFLYCIIDNKRFQYLKEIFVEYKKLYYKEKDIALVDVYSNSKLSVEEKKKIVLFLETKLNKKIEIHEITSNDYKGIKLVFDGVTIDYTLESRLNKMHSSI